MKAGIFRLLIAVLILSGCQVKNKQVSVVDYVDPFIGNVGHLLQPTRPTVQLPNQSVRMHPLRADYIDDQISAFPLTMASHRQPITAIYTGPKKN